MLEKLKEDVCRANKMLAELGLAVFTWGNASGIDRKSGLVAIKPSGVPYDALTPDDIVLLDLNGKKAEGNRNPSTDAPTHIHLYNSFPSIGGVVHTHSRWATVRAQAGKPIPPYGTTHADFAFGFIPCTRALTKAQVESDYELNTGRSITRLFGELGIDYKEVPAALAGSHGPFAWGGDCMEAVEHAAVLEEVAMLAWHTEALGRTEPIEPYLLEKHYQRKHGPGAYYGQKESGR